MEVWWLECFKVLILCYEIHYFIGEIYLRVLGSCGGSQRL